MRKLTIYQKIYRLLMLGLMMFHWFKLMAAEESFEAIKNGALSIVFTLCLALIMIMDVIERISNNQKDDKDDTSL